MKRKPAPPTAPAKSGRISVAIGSWADAEYVGVLYPPGAAAKDRLKTYATHFDHVEVNATYYRTPQRAQVEGWMSATPESFTFDLKLHRAFSERPGATAREGSLLARLREGVAPLVDAGRLGAYLLVLAPSFAPAADRLDELRVLAEALAPQPLAVELRHSGWVEDGRRAETLDYFRTHGLAWVAVDMPRIAGSTIMPPVDEATDPRVAYLRLHGRNPRWLQLKTAAEKHAYAYSAAEIDEIAGRVATLARGAERVRVVANNHAHDFAPKTALALKVRLAGRYR